MRPLPDLRDYVIYPTRRLHEWRSHWHEARLEMLLVTKKIAAIAASVALFSSSSAALADGAAAATTQTQLSNPWLMLSALSGSQSGANAAAAPATSLPAGARAGASQADRPGTDQLISGSEPLLPVLVWIGLLAIVISSSDNHNFLRPNSPA